jgi:hypothetical protein
MLDGRVLTQVLPVENFATEGPIWNLDYRNQGITVTGKTVTIPQFIDLGLGNVEQFIFGSSVFGQDGITQTGIGAFNFGELSDGVATTTSVLPDAVEPNMGPTRLGPARSLFSSSESVRRDFDAIARLSLTRYPDAYETIKANYFKYVLACAPLHGSALPPEFLERAGIRGNGPEDWVYPVTAGGTLKSEGTVYEDPNSTPPGQRFFIPDVEAVIELSENVASGNVLSVAVGNATTPDSFVVGQVLVIFNQDPRFGGSSHGVGGTEIRRSVFMDQSLGTGVATIGHMVGEHVLFVQEVETDLTDPTTGIQITADRFRIREGRGRIKWRGTVDKPAGINLFAVFNANGGAHPIPLAADPATGAANYTFRRRGLNITGGNNGLGITEVRLEARDANTNAVVAEETFDLKPFRN